MRPGLHLSRKAVIAVLFVLTFLVWNVVQESDWRFGSAEERWGPLIWAFVVFGTSALAAYDSTRVRLLRYKSGISYGPIGVFIVCAFFWPFALIWYAVVRVRIALGRMPEKRRPTQEGPISASGLHQPWRPGG